MSNVDDIFDRASHLFNVLTFARYKLELMPDEDIATAEIACAAIERWVSDFEYDVYKPPILHASTNLLASHLILLLEGCPHRAHSAFVKHHQPNLTSHLGLERG